MVQLYLYECDGINCENTESSTDRGHRWIRTLLDGHITGDGSPSNDKVEGQIDLVLCDECYIKLLECSFINYVTEKEVPFNRPKYAKDFILRLLYNDSANIRKRLLRRGV